MAYSSPPIPSTEVDAALALLRQVYPPHLVDPETPSSTPRTKPFVTLTYAQSLDGKIAGKGGKQIRLSGAESMNLTHRLRELHDSILVGIGTVLNDDPRLTARIPDLLPLASQPSPVILDSELRSPATCKLVKNAQTGLSKPVTILHASTDSRRNQTDAFSGNGSQLARRERLVDQGVTCVEVERDDSGHLDLRQALSQPNVFGRSLMVEGGASVITSFLASGLVDLFIVTVAPVLVGDQGISVTQPGVDLPELEHGKTQVFGRDTIFVCRPKHKR
ncbi:hypothetical protein JCM11641_008236 [Rhodosporidiobolus odoratus]